MPEDDLEPVEEDAWIVRFGIMALNDVRRSLQDANDDPDLNQWELSFSGDRGLEPEEIAELAQRPNPKMRLSTSKRLYDAGFSPFMDEPPEAHIGLRWEEKPPDEELKRLIDLFDEAIENPHPYR